MNKTFIKFGIVLATLTPIAFTPTAEAGFMDYMKSSSSDAQSFKHEVFAAPNHKEDEIIQNFNAAKKIAGGTLAWVDLHFVPPILPFCLAADVLAGCCLVVKGIRSFIQWLRS